MLKYWNGEKWYDCVYFCDIDIGITVFNKEENMYLLCLKKLDNPKRDMYLRVYHYIKTQIDKGVLTDKMLIKFIEYVQKNYSFDKLEYGTNPQAKDCPFNA